MGILLLMIVLLFEVSFAIYCIATKQHHEKIKSWFRIAIFLAFVMLTRTSVIMWSFRWVLIAILLFLLAATGAISLIRNKATQRKYLTSHLVWKSIFMIVTLALALTPAIVFPQHKFPKITGQYEVSTASYTYIDQNRIEKFADKGGNRFVNVEFWYPENAKGKYPFLVFSHGAYGIKTSNSSTLKGACEPRLCCRFNRSSLSFLLHSIRGWNANIYQYRL